DGATGVKTEFERVKTLANEAAKAAARLKTEPTALGGTCSRTSLRGESLGKFHDRLCVDIAVLVCALQKFPDRVAASLAIIAGKIVHIHADEFAGQARIHVARVPHGMAHRLISMGHAVLDAFAHDREQFPLD